MPNYTTELKTWGANGQEFPDGYNYEEGEQPVDAWDNFFNANVIDDIEHLIDVTNNDLLAKDGSTDLTGTLSDNDGYTIWDYNNKYIPRDSLEYDSIYISAGAGVDASNSVDLGETLSISHEDTSSRSDYSAADGYAVTDMQFDNFGHVTGVQATDLDNRYIESDGDSMDGPLSMSGFGMHGVTYLRSEQSFDDIEFRDSNGSTVVEVDTESPEIRVDGNKVWDQNNDGPGTGLHADRIDGYHIQKDGQDGNGIINFKT